MSVKQSLVLDGEKGELVRPSGRMGKKIVVSESKSVAALKSHSEAERRRRERINAHLDTLRGLVTSNEKILAPMAFYNKVGSMLRQSISASTSLSGQSAMMNVVRSMTTKLFVGGLSYGVDDQSLNDAFCSFGEVEFDIEAGDELLVDGGIMRFSIIVWKNNTLGHEKSGTILMRQEFTCHLLLLLSLFLDMCHFYLFECWIIGCRNIDCWILDIVGFWILLDC